MPRAFDGTRVPERLDRMPCGGVPEWDYPSECSYRCNECNAIIGSMGQSDRCKELNKAESKDS